MTRATGYIEAKKDLQAIKRMIPFTDPESTAKFWSTWRDKADNDPWVKALREFGKLGGKIIHWCGVPGHSILPLCFELQLPNGAESPSNSRLKDIKWAILTIKGFNHDH